MTIRKAWPLAFWTTAVALGALQAWIYRNAMNPDGVAYLDLADAYLRGDWRSALSAYWSPLYPALLAVAMALLQPSPPSEFAVLHLVNFCLYLSALGSFEYFIRGLMAYRQRVLQPADNSIAPLADWALRAVGYMLFIWTSLEWIGLGLATPDMVLTVIVYWASGQVLRIRAGSLRPRALAYGITLGVGYLVRAVMLPLSIVFIAAGALSAGRTRDRMVLLGVSLAGFLLISLPFIGAISSTRGRLTGGDVGPIAYAWYVNGLPLFAHWDGAGGGIPLHPPRRVLDDPPVYEFKQPIGGTFPLWFDPSYWHEGFRVEINPWQQVRRLLYTTNAYVRMVLNGSERLGRSGNWIFGLAALLLLARVPTLTGFSRLGFLFLPALADLTLLWLVHVEPRYIASFVVVLILGVLAVLHLATAQRPGVVAGIVAATGAVWLSCVLSLTQQMISDALNRTGDNPAWEVASHLKMAGVNEGSAVAIVGDSFVAYWARLARVHIVGDLPQWYLDQFWDGDLSMRQRVIAALETAGAEVVVADRAPSWAAREGWFRIGESQYYAYRPRQRDHAD